eukprot:TRINITY_DN4080_c0_g1_i2.p1 TRINITY_DN4080_c0_g1~~TRINITY_DN4080_c0_g1_i2.p1  ORF type:complete len:137 (+),score=26.25 TRINITY_DN4080_c0_g1_i2:150-560(+)
MTTPNELESKFTETIQKVELASRPVLKKEYECSAKCASNSRLSSQEFQNCIRDCGRASQEVGNTLNKEVNSFQNQVMSCMQTCENMVRAKLPTDATSIPPALQQEADSCAAKCSQDGLALLPAMMERMMQVINRHK